MARSASISQISWIFLLVGTLFVGSAALRPGFCAAQENATETENDEDARADEAEQGPDGRRLSRAEHFEALVKEVEQLERQSDVLKKVARLVRPTVVHIDAETSGRSNDGSGRKLQVEETGSGFIVEISGHHYVITNRHVVKYAAIKDIKIKLADGREIKPTKVWSDPDTDVGVLAIAAPRLVASRIGDSSKLEIGDFILAIGSPFGLSHSVTFGIVSATGRRNLPDLAADVLYQDFFQIDAAVNPGNSGGPLINLRGEVVGVNTAIATTTGSNDGVGFSIPINMVMIIARQLVERGSVERAYLGVSLDRHFGPAEAATVGLRNPRGARVTLVTPNSPADSAQIKVGDVILEFDGSRVDGDSHLPGIVSLSEIGKTVPVLILRERKEMTVMVKLGTLPSVRAAK